MKYNDYKSNENQNDNKNENQNDNKNNISIDIKKNKDMKKSKNTIKNNDSIYSSLPHYLHARRVKPVVEIGVKKYYYKYPELNNGNKEAVDLTHTGMGSYQGAYSVPDDEKALFNQIYLKELKKEQKEPEKNRKLSLIERHTNIGPIVCDIDLRYNYEGKLDRKYTKKHIQDFIKLYMKEIKNVFNLRNEEDMTAFIFERKEPYTKKMKENVIIKDGVHIMFPYIISYPIEQLLIRENLMKNEEVKNIFNDINSINPLSDIIDKSVIDTNGWMMYGSIKPGTRPYKLSTIYSHEMDELDISDYDEEQLPYIFSIRKKNLAELTQLHEEIKSSEKLSKLNNRKFNLQKKRNNKNQLHFYDIEYIRKIVSILSPERATQYQKWIELGWCMHNIDPNNEELLEIWDNFSKQGHSYSRGDCEKRWKMFRDDGFTLRSLKYWASIDNPEKYNQLNRENIIPYIEKSLSRTDWDVANVIYQLYKDTYKYIGGKSNMWYVFTGQRWEIDDEGRSLRSKISTSVVAEYTRMISFYNQQSISGSDDDSDDDDDTDNKYQKKTEVLLSIVKKLKMSSDKGNFMKECKDFFHDKDFYKKLDTNINLIGLENGVYDLEKDEFRDGRPEDYISLCTNVSYYPHSENNQLSPEIVKINEFVSQVFPDKDKRHYIMKNIGSFLHGATKDEKFHTLLGSGGNGKSKLLELIIKTMGDYAINFPVTLITRKRKKSGEASPELAEARGRRFGYMSEPSDRETIDVGIFKELTGGDVIKARALYKEYIEFKPQFKLWLLCNEIPKVPPHDQGTWRRMVSIECNSKFVDNPNPNNPYEFPIDRELSQKIDSWREGFLWLMIEYYREYKKEGLVLPECLIKTTEEYRRSCDSYSNFIDEYVCKVTPEMQQEQKQRGKRSASVRIDDLYGEFEDWYDEYYKGKRAVSKADFIDYLKKKYGKSVVKRGRIYGYIFLSEKYNEDRTKNDLENMDDDEEYEANNNNTYKNYFEGEQAFGNFLGTGTGTAIATT